MFFYLTFEAFKNNSRSLSFIRDINTVFDEKVDAGNIRIDNLVKKYAWSIDEKTLNTEDELFSLSISCKTAIYISQLGTDCCFDLNSCSLVAINNIFVDNYFKNIGIILDSPVLLSMIVSPHTIMPTSYEGTTLSVDAETPFELFSAGVKDVCEQVKQKTNDPVIVFSTYEKLLDTNLSLDEYAEALKTIMLPDENKTHF